MSRLAQLLADRLRLVVPEVFQVTPEDDRVVIVGPDGLPAAIWCDGALDGFLSSIQDEISHTIKDPWPRDPHARGVQMAPPFVITDGPLTRLGYGTPERPVLELLPLPTRELPEQDRDDLLPGTTAGS